MGLEVARAQGSYIFDSDETAYLDFVAGVSACSLGHCHPKVVAAIQEQAAKYMHVMVYGEFIQGPAVDYARFLASRLPKELETTYLVNSGTEAIEGSLKLARRATGRSEIIAARNAYHGNTMGSLSLMGLETRKAPFRPLLPDISYLTFNHLDDLEKITRRTAAVILETIQGGAGFIVPDPGYLEAIRNRCNEVGCLLILDEIQPGFGRTGKLFAFEHFQCVPDILVMGKGMASGLPVGGFTASKSLMSFLSDQPEFGHITTFGGNPVIAAACLATLQEIISTDLIPATLVKENLIRNRLRHDLIREIRGKGLMLAVIMEEPYIADFVIRECMKRGLLLFWLLFEPCALRISPPLTITGEEIDKGCDLILEVLDDYTQ